MLLGFLVDFHFGVSSPSGNFPHFSVLQRCQSQAPREELPRNSIRLAADEKKPVNDSVSQFPYQKKAFTFLGLVFFSRETNHQKKVKG